MFATHRWRGLVYTLARPPPQFQSDAASGLGRRLSAAARPKKGKGTRVRSSETGRFVPPDEAKRNPRETETERIMPRKK